MTSVAMGDRVRLVKMGNDPDPVEQGMTGTVLFVTDLSGLFGTREFQIGVKWDNGRSLSLVVPPDEYEVVREQR